MVNTCKNCSRNFKRKDNLKRHLKNNICQDFIMREYNCPLCIERFTRKNALKMHLTRHEAPYQCPHCTLRYIKTESFLYHINQHTGPKNFQCSNCSKTFNRNSNKQEHERSCSQMSGGSASGANNQFTPKIQSNNLKVFEFKFKNYGIWSAELLRGLMKKDLVNLLTDKGPIKYQVAIESVYQNALNPEIITERPVIFKSEMMVALGK